MEKINTEIIINSLFAIGFDKVDSLLFTYVLGKLSNDSIALERVELEEREFSENFNKYVEYSDTFYQLKYGYSMDSIVSLMPIQNIELSLIKVLNTNKFLIQYLKELDFREIIVKKIIALGIDRINDYEMLFSKKEKEIISNMFGIDDMYRYYSIKHLQKYRKREEQQERENKRMIEYLDNRIQEEKCKKLK